MPGVGVLLKLLQGVPIWVWLVVAAVGYNFWIENPRIAREARIGYVQAAEKAALEAELAETKRQRDASARAASAWQSQLERFQAQEDDRAKQLEADIAEFEQTLASAGRSCRLTDDDLRFLRK